MFGNWASSAILHLGSYALPVLAFCAGVAGVRAVFPRLALCLVGVNALLMLAIYPPSVNPPSGPNYLPDPGYGPVYLPLAALLALASLVGFAAVALTGDDALRRWVPVSSVSRRSRDRVGARGS
jgi:hypothetical protein